MLKLDRIYKSETVLEILQNAILSGDIEPNTLITQSDAALSLGISRMPVREALIALEFYGLVERLPGQHIVVSNLNDEFIKNIFSDMALLEFETIKNLNSESLNTLLITESQIEFHKKLCKLVNSTLRKKFLKINTEVYFEFVIKNSVCPEQINDAFKNLLKAIKFSDSMQSAFEIYAESLALELINIRKEKKNRNVKS